MADDHSNPPSLGYVRRATAVAGIPSKRAQLPPWVESALETFAPKPPFNETEPNEEARARHEALCDHVRKCWRDLRIDFVSEIDKLRDDIGKQLVFEQVLVVLKWFHPAATKKLRDARVELMRLDGLVIDQARELAATLRQRDQLKEHYEMIDNLPNLWEAIDHAAQRYPEWHMVSRGFLVRVRTQSRPGPNFSRHAFRAR